MSEALATVDEVEGSTGESDELREKMKDLRNRVESNYWELSVGMHQVYHESAYLDWGYESFNEYVDRELDFQLRKAQYLVNIQDWAGKMTPAMQKWIKEIGWTKAKELTKIVKPEDASKWKKKLKDKSFKEMMEILNKHKDTEREKTSGDTGDEASEKAASKNFKLFPGQMDNVNLALERAMEAAETSKPGNALDLICIDYLSSNQGVATVTDLLSRIEKITGLKIVALNTKEDVIVYGEDTLDSLGDNDSEDEADSGENKAASEE